MQKGFAKFARYVRNIGGHLFFFCGLGNFSCRCSLAAADIPPRQIIPQITVFYLLFLFNCCLESSINLFWGEDMLTGVYQFPKYVRPDVAVFSFFRWSLCRWGRRTICYGPLLPSPPLTSNPPTTWLGSEPSLSHEP